MTRRPIVTIHLPLEMGAIRAILAAVAREFPDATVGQQPAGTSDCVVVANDSPLLTAELAGAGRDLFPPDKDER